MKPAPAAALRPAARDREGQRHDGLSAAGQPGLHLRRTPRGVAGSPPHEGRRMHFLPCRRRGHSRAPLRRGQRCPRDPRHAGRDRARTAHFGRRRMAGTQRPAADDLFARRRVARAVRLAAAGRRRRGPDALRGRRPASARGVSGRDFGGDFQTPQFAGRVRHRVDDGGLHLAAAPPFADRAHPLRGRAARRGARSWASSKPATSISKTSFCSR